MLMRGRKSASWFTAFALICIGACGTSDDGDGGADLNAQNGCVAAVDGPPDRGGRLHDGAIGHDVG